jgi:hypothetical protein
MAKSKLHTSKIRGTAAASPDWVSAAAKMGRSVRFGFLCVIHRVLGRDVDAEKIFAEALAGGVVVEAEPVNGVRTFIVHL